MRALIACRICDEKFKKKSISFFFVLVEFYSEMYDFFFTKDLCI